MNQITIIQSITPSKVCKTYSKNAAGNIEKNVIANVIEGKAVTQNVNTAQEMVSLLDYVTAKDNFVLCAGTWRGAPADEFTLIAEADLAKRLGKSIGDAELAGVHEINGEHVAARLKRSIEPSNWVLLDADNPPGIPQEWAAMSIAERLNLWEPLLPGISHCERIELRGSSARVINGSGSQKATHAWIRVSDAQKIALMKAHVSIEMVNKGLSFQFKKQSRIEPGRVVGIESRSVFDLAVFDTGRLVFCAKPEVLIEGYRADSAGVEIINKGNGELDIGWIKQPGQAALNQYKEKTGIQLDLQVKGGFLSVHSNGQLTMGSEITSRGTTKPLSDWTASMKIGDKLRCESPFRESVSEAAFIKIGDDGQPFIYDVGNGTTYHLQNVVKADPAGARLEPLVDLTPVSGATLMENIKPLHFVVEDIFARGYVYTLTAKNNHGKSTLMALLTQCITSGQSLGPYRVENGRVLILAGENTYDTILKLKALNLDASMFDVVDGAYEMRAFVKQQLASLKGPYSGIFVDSNQAYFGDGEMNSNSEALAHAKAFRSLTKAGGNPFICILSHPVKNAEESNLVPYGGNAFINEIDGNLTLHFNQGLAKFSHTKLRQPSFGTLDLKLHVHEFTEMRNNFGKPTTTTTFEVLTADEAFVENHKEQMIKAKFLMEYKAPQKPSYSELGDKYFTNPMDPENPNQATRKKKAERLSKLLIDEKLVTKSLYVTKKGRDFIYE
jgi:hypothetical protein